MKYIDRFKNIEAFLNSDMQQLTGDRIATIEGFELPILKKKTKTVIDPSTNAEVEELQDVWMVPVGEVEKKVEHDYKVHMLYYKYNDQSNLSNYSYYELGSVYHEYRQKSLFSTGNNEGYYFRFKLYDNGVEITSQIKTTSVDIVENNNSFVWNTHYRPGGAYDYWYSGANSGITEDVTTKMRVTFTFDDDSTYSQDFDFVQVLVEDSTMLANIVTGVSYRGYDGTLYPFVYDSTSNTYTLTRTLPNSAVVQNGSKYNLDITLDGGYGSVVPFNSVQDCDVYGTLRFSDGTKNFMHTAAYITDINSADYVDSTHEFTATLYVTGTGGYKQNENGEFYRYVGSPLNGATLKVIFVIGNGGVETFEIDPSFGMNDYEAPLTGAWGLSSRFYTPKYNDASVSWNDVSYNSISCQRLDNGEWVTDSSANVSVSTGTDPKYTINWSGLNTSTYYKLLAEFEYNSIPTIYSLTLATTSTAPTPQPTITYVLGTSNGLADNSATLNITNNTAGNDSAASKVFNNLVLWNTDGNGGLVEVNGSYYQSIDYESNFTAVMSSTNPNGAGYDYSLGADNITFYFGDQNDATINADTTAEYTIQFTYNGYTMYYTVTCVWGNGGSSSTPDPSTGTTIVPVLGTSTGIFDNYAALNIPNGTAGNAGASSKNFDLVLWNTDGNGALVEVNGSNYQTIDVNDVSVSVSSNPSGAGYNTIKLSSSIDVYLGDQNDATNNANKTVEYLITFTYNGLNLYYTVYVNWCVIITENEPDRSSDGQGYRANTTIKKVFVNEGVTSLGESAFNGCTNLEEVTLPSTLTRLGLGCFIGTKIASITIPEGCRGHSNVSGNSNYGHLGYGTFMNCKSLINVSIPSSITDIDTVCFKGCTSLSSIYIPDSIKSIATKAFENCSSLTSVEIPYGCTYYTDSFPSSCTVTRRSAPSA